MQIRVIADDFTSATDALPAFAQRGWATRVVLRPTPLAVPETSEVWSTDTDSRTLPDEVAAALVAGWARRWRDASILLKQFDSTLRGPVVPEVMAAWRASGRSKLVVAPAFPGAGRTTVGGNVLVDGVPVNETAFARDPLNPVCVSSLPALFAAQGQTLHCARNTVAAEAQLALHDAVVVDAQTEADLGDLVMRLGARPDVLWAGSTGLLRAFAMTLPTQAAIRPSWQAAQRPGVVVGSQNPRSREQHRHAQAKVKGATLWATPEERGDPERLTALLVHGVCEAVLAGRCDGLVVTGGETAKHIARRLQAQEICVLREVQPGIPLCLMHTPRGVIPLVTKAGGFGDDDVFMQCVQAMTGEQ
ncbi:four-carbon acid sugar kinase family protein [Aquincola sp. S2]|uniref:Four-carbon acid sugar kinase family protein n=1 Tax=Pseudaquabacterium terrae TaxID=2732868 RepID=A0ABX2EQ59_9BURK|nr:four-carbon acid sugar kinase family protein [Aquabacterium terrae]NRF70782.1 four-carbon acid sugar kinase family protein [Aquabacterium terrae]